MTCTAAAIIAFLGYMPAKGTVIIVPRSSLTHASTLQQRKAQTCVRLHGIQWRIDEEK